MYLDSMGEARFDDEYPSSRKSWREYDRRRKAEYKAYWKSLPENYRRVLKRIRKSNLPLAGTLHMDLSHLHQFCSHHGGASFRGDKFAQADYAAEHWDDFERFCDLIPLSPK